MPAGTTGSQLSRRSMLRTAMFATVGMAFSGLAGGAGAFVWPIKLTGFGGTVVVPKRLSEIQVGDVLKVREGKFYLTRTEDGLMALYWKCVHLGCTVPWKPDEGLFICPCHISTYLPNGQNVAGPATRPLDFMALTVDGERVMVDTSKVQSRPFHRAEHAVKV